MPDAVVSAVVQTALRILSSAALQEIGLHWGFNDELDRLQSTLSTIQLVLHDAEIKQRKNAVLQDWLRRLKDATYDAENTLDHIATDGLRRRANLEGGTQSRVKHSCFSFGSPLLSRMKMAHQVRDIRKKIDAIAKERHQFHLGEGVMHNRFGVTLESRQTTSLLNKETIYGRSEEKEAIMKKIVDGTCDEDDDLSVYAVQGMGGLGKTTLAQMVFNDERTIRHFDLRIWVCISDDFCIQRIVRETLDSIERGGCSNSSLDTMERDLQEKLRGRRFLLVLDDVWNEKPRLWDELKKVLRCGSKGSVLIVTTRSEKVASMMAPIANVHRLDYLSEVDSWELFRQTVFTDGQGEENFTAIGKVMVKKCGGVPLAIKALGSLMRFKSDESEWLAVKDSEIWNLLDDDNDILPALRLSYDNLVPQMRQCFAYCCIFPKDYLMEENKLIQLWMANGYIPDDSQPDMLVTGRLIIRELVWRSFLQDAERDFRGNVRYQMHDLMHDLALSVMGHDSHILEWKVPTIPKTVRHLSFDTRYSWDVRPIANSLRSIIAHGDSFYSGNFTILLSKQQYLRALDASCYESRKLPSLVCKLKHLRYLTMRCNNIKRLPESLTHLYNLQTLKLINSGDLVELPRGMKVMKNLWFLDIERFNSLLCTPPELGALTYLHRLSIFIVGQDASHQIDQLKDLDLEGELTIKGLDNVESMEAARSANLMRKKNLSSVSLSWTHGIENKSAKHYEEVLQGLQPHQNLEKITIKSFHGSRFANWMSASIFGKLKRICLRDCPRCEHIPPLGKLPSLTHLSLRGLDSVECWDVECYGNGESPYPALKNLEIEEMPNFEEWTIPDSVESFPCLKDLRIYSCRKLTGLPKLPNLEVLELYNDVCEALIRSITSITSLTSLQLWYIETLDVVPEGLLQNHKALRHLHVESLPIRSLSNMLDNLSALKSLALWNCSNLEFIPEGLKYLRCLETLSISRCEALISFPATLLEDLSSLRSLRLISCKKLKPLSGPLKQAPPLQQLWIHDLPELEYLPESMHLFTSLRTLHISYWKGLCSLPNWLGSLESLSEIHIYGCEKLMSLPDGFTNLKSLRALSIKGCPELAKRCKKPNGEDWPKISHVRFVSINNKTVQELDDV